MQSVATNMEESRKNFHAKISKLLKSNFKVGEDNYEKSYSTVMLQIKSVSAKIKKKRILNDKIKNNDKGFLYNVEFVNYTTYIK